MIAKLCNNLTFLLTLFVVGQFSVVKAQDTIKVDASDFVDYSIFNSSWLLSVAPEYFNIQSSTPGIRISASGKGGKYLRFTYSAIIPISENSPRGGSLGMEIPLIKQSRIMVAPSLDVNLIRTSPGKIMNTTPFPIDIRVSAYARIGKHFVVDISPSVFVKNDETPLVPAISAGIGLARFKQLEDIEESSLGKVSGIATIILVLIMGIAHFQPPS